jgi:hypothetical protein
MSLRTLYSSMLQCAQPLPEAVLRRAYAQAHADRAVALIASIIGRVDCPDDLVEAGRTSRNLEVRAAYLSRSGPVDERRRAALAGERARGALVRVGSDRRTPTELLDVLAESEYPVVAAAVLGNHTAPAVTRRRALLALDRRFAELPESAREEFALSVQHTLTVPGPGPDDAPIELTSEALVRIDLDRRLLTEPDRTATVLAWLTRLVDDPDRHGHPLWPKLCQEAGCLPGPAQRQLVEIGQGVVDLVTQLDLAVFPAQALNQAVKAAGVVACGDNGNAANQAARWLARHANQLVHTPDGPAVLCALAAHPNVEHVFRDGQHTLSAVLSGGPDADQVADGNTVIARLVRARTATDGDMLLALARQPDIIRTPAMVEALLTNPDLPVDVAAHLVDVGVADAVEMVDRFPDAPAVLIAALLQLPGDPQRAVARRSAQHPDHDRIAAAVISALTADRNLVPSQENRGVSRRLRTLEVLAGAGLVDDAGWLLVDAAVGEIPAHAFVFGLADPFLAWRAGVMLDRLMTAHPTAVEAVDVLSKEFTGSWSELLTVARLTT